MNRAVLFDLDGTLADTALDLGRALNTLRIEEGREPIDIAILRPHVSGGARALLKVGFGLAPEDADYESFRRRFLARYEADICVDTVLFDGMAELLAGLDQRAIPWGIVTNKAHRYAVALMEALRLSERAACIVGGDSCARPKPAPDPLLMASGLIGSRPEETLYVGDDLRDVVAGKAAGMMTVAVSYGYLGDGPPIADWGADRIISTPVEILGLV